MGIPEAERAEIKERSDEVRQKRSALFKMRPHQVLGGQTAGNKTQTIWTPTSDKQRRSRCHLTRDEGGQETPRWRDRES